MGSDYPTTSVNTLTRPLSRTVETRVRFSGGHHDRAESDPVVYRPGIDSLNPRKGGTMPAPRKYP